jgi:peptidoglycan/LPS O-acetylase OafA/YrhL
LARADLLPLYLVHVPIIVATVGALHAAAPLWVLLAGAVAGSLAVAHALHVMVERPTIRLSRIIAARLAAPELAPSQGSRIRGAINRLRRRRPA